MDRTPVDRTPRTQSLKIPAACASTSKVTSPGTCPASRPASCPTSLPPSGLAHWLLSRSSAVLSLEGLPHPLPRLPAPLSLLSICPHSPARPLKSDLVLPPLKTLPWLPAGLGKEPSSLAWDSRPFRTWPLLTFTSTASCPCSGQQSPLSIHLLPDTSPNCPGLLPGL